MIGSGSFSFVGSVPLATVLACAFGLAIALLRVVAADVAVGVDGVVVVVVVVGVVVPGLELAELTGFVVMDGVAVTVDVAVVVVASDVVGVGRAGVEVEDVGADADIAVAAVVVVAGGRKLG